ncbi:MAG: ClpXP protease specificity-enhancing factor [Gammaproteobacteria bacterium]|nr:ClpXP protease specificity-enhancing factor [Gammaproteobacteria bacterium]
MTSNRPYLIRALYEWLVDNELTPYLLVDADLPHVEVPREFVEEGRIVLNVNPRAISNLELGNEWIRFSARFKGVLEDVIVPPVAVLGIYAKENGQGMLFASEEGGDGQPEDEPDPPKPGKRATLKVVK